MCSDASGATKLEQEEADGGVDDVSTSQYLPRYCLLCHNTPCSTGKTPTHICTQGLRYVLVCT